MHLLDPLEPLFQDIGSAFIKVPPRIIQDAGHLVACTLDLTGKKRFKNPLYADVVCSAMVCTTLWGTDRTA